MKLTTSTKLLISSLGLCHVSVSAFSPEARSTTTSFIQRSNPIPSLHTLNALPGGGSELIDLHQSLTHLIDTSSTLLSDAAAAVVEEEKIGAWDNYLQLYKSLLENVHSTIDAPLRSVGWDQTWGISIFLFTAGTLFIYFVACYSIIVWLVVTCL